MTDKEAISNLNQIYGFVSSDIQQSLDLAIKALMENDLISRSELKKAIKKSAITLPKYGRAIFLNNLNDLIDNIQTVSEKPQGEWKIIEHETQYLMGIYQCNLCSYKYTCPDEFARNFCPNCGAKMKQG